MANPQELAILSQCEPDESGLPGSSKYTQRAQEAQAARAKWRRLFATYGPVEKLNRKHLASTRNPHPEKRLYGWAHPFEFVERYANQNKLPIRLPKHLAKKYGKKVLICGQLTEIEAKDPEMKELVKDSIVDVVLDHVRKLAGVSIKYEFVYSGENHGIFVLYDNYNMAERLATIAGLKLNHDDVVAKVQSALASCDNTIKPLWWYDRSLMLRKNLHTPL
ncbi:hypothetical protein PYCCODRAFT_805198 [Trametes coccinea BRFM310]|uniref:Uncharacterized protein n=1 Tax=Trametes coccinea (strain BRFM310) TaxID=1353009 RepID=A0A1Y2IF56_TRAC3|nr:hypothetical protein PYCCODRAFT_805198 [Trametes coccinea BRFM310]